MPFINVKIAGADLAPGQIGDIQRGVTELMVTVLDKDGPVVAVAVDQVPASHWSVGATPVTRAVQVEAIVSAGSNSPEQKARFVSEAFGLMKTVVGPDVSEVSYVVIREIDRDSWGYGGFTQLHRATHQA